MRIVMFYHSLISDWNHGNAHFLRGVTSDLLERGHNVTVYEPAGGWSCKNLLAAYGESPLERFRKAYPKLASVPYELAFLNLEEALQCADLVLVHEWNEPELVERIGLHRAAQSVPYRLFFHDTHHRAATEPEAIARYRLENYDGILAFGQSVADEYHRRGWGRRVWVWHEAADHRVFFPRDSTRTAGDLVWIGNWGDDERGAELREYLVQPVGELGLRARVHGVRYPPSALAELQNAGIEYAGWVPNFEVPEVFSRYSMTVHIPRRPYAQALPGVPTIRIFEALACGIPLISAPWDDIEQLFTAGEDFLFAQNGADMQRKMSRLLSDRERARELAGHGRETILRRHTCSHRVTELLQIYGSLEMEVGARSAMTIGAVDSE